MKHLLHRIANWLGLWASGPLGLWASGPLGPKGIPIYVYRLTSLKHLIYSMNHIKPATAIVACAGIRRMEFGQPPALGMRTCGGKAAGQWLLAMGFAKREHPSRNYSASGERDSLLEQRIMLYKKPELKRRSFGCSQNV